MSSSGYEWTNLQPSLVLDTQEIKIVDSILNSNQYNSYREPRSLHLPSFGAESTFDLCGHSDFEDPWSTSPLSSDLSSSDYCDLSPRSKIFISGESLTDLNLNSPSSIMSADCYPPGRNCLDKEQQLAIYPHYLSSPADEMSVWNYEVDHLEILSTPLDQIAVSVSDVEHFEVENLRESISLETIGSVYENSVHYLDNANYQPSTTDYSPQFETNNWSIGNSHENGSSNLSSSSEAVYLNSNSVAGSDMDISTRNMEVTLQERKVDNGMFEDMSSPSTSQGGHLKPKRANRQKKEFYDGLTQEERKQREKKMEKERARKYRIKEKERAQDVTRNFKVEEKRNGNLKQEVSHLTEQVTILKTILGNKNKNNVNPTEMVEVRNSIFGFSNEAFYLNPPSLTGSETNILARNTEDSLPQSNVNHRIVKDLSSSSTSQGTHSRTRRLNQRMNS